MPIYLSAEDAKTRFSIKKVTNNIDILMNNKVMGNIASKQKFWYNILDIKCYSIQCQVARLIGQPDLFISNYFTYNDANTEKMWGKK